MHENHGKGLFGFLADEESGEYVEKSLIDKFVVLLNKVHSYNNSKNEVYFNKINIDGVSKDFDIGFNSKRLDEIQRRQRLRRLSWQRKCGYSR